MLISLCHGLVLTVIKISLLFSLCLCTTTSLIGSRGGGSFFEELDRDEQLNILNKPSVKSIETPGGDVFDCVDIYKQPALDHPLLKKHRIQLRPVFPKKKSTGSTRSSSLLGDGCPSGTVPIKRTSKEDLMRAQSFMDRHIMMLQTHNSSSDGPPAYHSAIRELPAELGGKYWGAGGKINIQNPQVSMAQFSEAFVRIQSGRSNPPDSIQVGWMVNPHLYGDNRTRSFGFWTAGKSGCFDLLCPGFVQISSTTPLSYLLQNISIYGGMQFDLARLLFRDKNKGNWWVVDADNLGIQIGYWPGSLFGDLSSEGDNVIWGGSALASDTADSPPMGSGHFPAEGVGKAAYIKNLKIIDTLSVIRSPTAQDLKSFSDDTRCYDVTPIPGDPDGLLFGGPGGNCVP